MLSDLTTYYLRGRNEGWTLSGSPRCEVSDSVAFAIGDLVRKGYTPVQAGKIIATAYGLPVSGRSCNYRVEFE